MRTTTTTTLIVVALVALVGACLPTLSAAEETHTGYLVDMLCWNRGTGLDGADMKHRPQDHTVHCLRDIQACIDSGFAIAHRPATAAATDEYTLTHRFDAAGNALAVDYVNNISRSQLNNVYVKITGTPSSSTSLFSLTSIVSASVDDDIATTTTTTTSTMATTTTTNDESNPSPAATLTDTNGADDAEEEKDESSATRVTTVAAAVAIAATSLLML